MNSRWPHNPCPSPPGLHEPPIPKFAWAPLLEGVMKPPPVMKSLHGGGTFHAFTGTVLSISTAAIATRSPPAKSAATSLAIALSVLLIVVFLALCFGHSAQPLRNTGDRSGDHHIGNTNDGDVKGIHGDGAA